jgi:hypothetical protein
MQLARIHNFPRRFACRGARTLLRNDEVTPVPVSIDPFFVRYVPD